MVFFSITPYPSYTLFHLNPHHPTFEDHRNDSMANFLVCDIFGITLRSHLWKTIYK